MVSSFLARWDTPERRFAHEMDRACGVYYDYSKTDGYCHFNHRYDDMLVTTNPNGHGYAMVKAPPAEGALENIARLKQQHAAQDAAR